MNFFGLIFLTIIIEGVITYVNTFFVDGKLQWQMITGIVLGAVVAVTYGVDACHCGHEVPCRISGASLPAY